MELAWCLVLLAVLSAAAEMPNDVVVEPVASTIALVTTVAPRAVLDVTDVVKEDSKDTGPASAFNHGFFASLGVIIVTELGDKTFFIAAIMAMKHGRLVIYTGAMLALGTMHILSCLVGVSATFIPRYITYYASSLLFAIFGLRMLKEAWEMSPDENEFEEAREELSKRDTSAADVERGLGATVSIRRRFLRFCSPVFVEAFTLTFLAEWGDRSQIATIVLTARENLYGVIVGGLLGHSLCTGLAVLGGRAISTRISARTITFAGAVVFLLFAASALFLGPGEEGSDQLSSLGVTSAEHLAAMPE